jgi:hypothetical protein
MPFVWPRETFVEIDFNFLFTTGSLMRTRPFLSILALDKFTFKTSFFDCTRFGCFFFILRHSFCIFWVNVENVIGPFGSVPSIVVLIFAKSSWPFGMTRKSATSALNERLNAKGAEKTADERPEREREALKPDFPFCHPRKRLPTSSRVAGLRWTGRLTRLQILQLFTHKL